MKIEHWMPIGLLGATGAFQRAAREYAEAYAAMAVAEERKRAVAACMKMPANLKDRQQFAAAVREKQNDV